MRCLYPRFSLCSLCSVANQFFSSLRRVLAPRIQLSKFSTYSAPANTSRASRPIHRIIGKQHDVSLSERHIQHRRMLRNLSAAITNPEISKSFAFAYRSTTRARFAGGIARALLCVCSGVQRRNSHTSDSCSSVLPLRRVRLQNPDRLSFRARWPLLHVRPQTPAPTPPATLLNEKITPIVAVCRDFFVYPYAIGLAPSTNCVPPLRPRFSFFRCAPHSRQRPFPTESANCAVSSTVKSTPPFARSFAIRQPSYRARAAYRPSNRFFNEIRVSSLSSTAKDFPKPSAIPG